MCRPHYVIARNGGAFKPRPYGVKPEVHFFAKVDTRGCCWEWTADCDRDGYGEFNEYDPITKLGTKHRAHRWCWQFLIGRIPEGMVLDHLCLNKACVMPDHLEIVTPQENARRHLALVQNY
jgi:hypothetical protein